MEVHQLASGILLTQRKYTLELLSRTNMLNSNPTPTPMIVSPKLKANDGAVFSDIQLYRSTVGGLQYICLTRPDIAYAVNKVSQYMNHPHETHWKAVKCILRYLNGTLQYGLWFSSGVGNFTLACYADADWAASVEDRRSTTGYCVYLGDNPVAWCSKKQSVVSRSTSEAEYRSVANSVSELIWVEQLLTELGVSLIGKPTIWCDNTSTVSMSANPTHHAKVKHVEIDLHFVREKVLSGQLLVNFVPSTEQYADILTKPIPPSLFGQMRKRLGIISSDEVQQVKLNPADDENDEVFAEK
ncbi:hypothetical protein V6N13_084595 [Hibiscus sabdariffa]